MELKELLKEAYIIGRENGTYSSDKNFNDFKDKFKEEIKNLNKKLLENGKH